MKIFIHFMGKRGESSPLLGTILYLKFPKFKAFPFSSKRKFYSISNYWLWQHLNKKTSTEPFKTSALSTSCPVNFGQIE